MPNGKKITRTKKEIRSNFQAKPAEYTNIYGVGSNLISMDPTPLS